MKDKMTIHILPIGMDDRKIAILRTAFRMHQSQSYAIVDNLFKDPDLAIADVDGLEGMSILDPFFKEYPETRLLITSINILELEHPSLQKPLRVETLFPMLRDIFAKEKTTTTRQLNQERSQASIVPPKIQAQIEGEKQNFASKQESKKIVDKEIPHIVTRPTLNVSKLTRFDPSKGLLGRLKLAQRNGEKTMVLYKGQPILLVSPEDDLVLLLVPLGTLRKLCELPETENEANFALKAILINRPPPQAHSIKLFNLLWQFAIWTADGRLVNLIKIDRPLKLKSWPNFTRVAPIPDAMRITAFLIRSPVNLGMLYKFLNVEIFSLMNFLAAAYITDLLEVEHAAPPADRIRKDIFVPEANEIKEELKPEHVLVKEEPEITEQMLIEEATKKPRSFLQKLLNKINTK